MTKEKWESMSDNEKTTFMRGVFKHMDLGNTFDYAKCVEFSERFKEAGGDKFFGVYDNPCIVLELIDPILACGLMGWMCAKFNNKGEYDANGTTAPLFGYELKEVYFNKGSLMNFSDTEKSILREGIKILNDKINNNFND